MRYRQQCHIGMMMVLSLALMACQQQVDMEAERTELLSVHGTDRRAHFTGDVDLLLSHGMDECIMVDRGRIDTMTAAQMRGQFKQYFEGATYSAWDDLTPPIIRISKDGTMAWMITRIIVRRAQIDSTGTGQESEFVYAGIMTYEKFDGKWLRTANVSTFE